MNDVQVIELVFSVCLNLVIGLFGSAANVINIIIFFKQGFNDSVNISLCGLAISDLCSILPLLYRRLFLNPLFRYSNIDFDSVQTEFLFAGWPHGGFVSITSWITAYITLERCVCVTLPMKVKDIITPRLTLITIVTIFLMFFAIHVPIFFSFYLDPIFDTPQNRTLYKFSFTTSGPEIENILFNINVIAEFISSFTVIACTIILIRNLLEVSQWRHQSQIVSSSTNSEAMTTRDKRVVKMITSIACIFMACLLPGTINIIVSIILAADYRINGRYQTAYQISFSVLIFLETVNSSISILVYYNMSSKFRATFTQLFIPESSDNKAKVSPCSSKMGGMLRS